MLPVLNSNLQSQGRLSRSFVQNSIPPRQKCLGTERVGVRGEGQQNGGRQLTSATFLLKYDCNLKCSFCLNAWRGKARPDDELRLEQQQEALLKLKEQGVRHVTFTGGEPALHPELAELILYAHSLGMTTILQTNGTLLRDEFLMRVKGKLNGIQVSLHGLRAEQKEISGFDCFERIAETMKRISASGIPLFTNFVATKKNVRCIRDYVAFLDSVGVKVASFTRLYPAGNALANWRELVLSGDEYAAFCKTLEVLQRTAKVKLYLAGPNDTEFLFKNGIGLQNATCGAGRTEIAINPNGDILPCPSWNEPAGNVLSNLATAWDEGFLAELGQEHDGAQGCMLARVRRKTELEGTFKKG